MRTLLATFYDSLIILSFIILLSFPIVIFNGGHAIAPGDKRYLFYILSIAWAYFWLLAKLSSQTIGMKAWRHKYVYAKTKHLFLSLLIRYCLFIPVSVLCLFQVTKRESILEQCCGIRKDTIPRSKKTLITT